MFPNNRLLLIVYFCFATLGCGINDKATQESDDIDILGDGTDLYHNSGEIGKITIHKSGRVASLLISAQDFDSLNTGPTPDISSLTKTVMQHFNDAFDFLILVSNNPTQPAGLTYSGMHHPISSADEGLGWAPFSLASRYGSDGHLKSVIHLTRIGSVKQGPLLHEILHHWANGMLDSANSGHWGYSSVGGLLGGFTRLEDLGGGTYKGEIYHPLLGRYDTFSIGGSSGVLYSNLELYAMGLIPATDVKDIQVARNPSAVDLTQGLFKADAIDTVTIADLIAKNGERKPSWQEAQKSFRGMVVIITPQPLSETTWDALADDVDMFSRESDVSSTTQNYNFWTATGGRATLNLGNLDKEVR